jgi:hypothetical protein
VSTETKPKTARQKAADRQLGRITDYKRTFGSDQGKRVLADLIASHFIMTSTYVRNDINGQAFNEGQRQVILRIMTLMNVDPFKMKQIIEESNNNVQDE